MRTSSAPLVGGQSAAAPLRRALVRPPRPEELAAWRDYGWRAEPDPVRIAAEHEAFRAVLADAGAEVVAGATPVPGDPDAVYACDPALVTDRGVLLLRPGKDGRRAEPHAMAADVRAAGVPVLGAMGAPAAAEGGDLLWLDRGTLLVGRSYRTNDHGIGWLRRTLPGVEVLAFDLPHLRGPGEVLHLLSLISLLDADLAVGFLPLLPARLVALLEVRGIRIVEVPEEELESGGPNVLALAPRVAVMVEGNPRTRSRLEAAGVNVRTYPAEELAGKGLGGPTCLVLPLLRAS
ncbi:MAG TPA: arginine deiminase family protein [Actinomycetota bacterium]|nr:arginine deiminase family protein [Actinomycetota bacterium]